QCPFFPPSLQICEGRGNQTTPIPSSWPDPADPPDPPTATAPARKLHARETVQNDGPSPSDGVPDRERERERERERSARGSPRSSCSPWPHRSRRVRVHRQVDLSAAPRAFERQLQIREHGDKVSCPSDLVLVGWTVLPRNASGQGPPRG